MIMGMTALAIDGGRLYSERRSTQNAADHAAVAAAFAECTGASVAEAQAAGLAAAADNGFDNNGTTNTVTITPDGSYRYRATVDSQIRGTFSRVLGATDLGTGATAVASCEPGELEGEALFANGSGCSEPELWIRGNNLEVNGGAHSNEDVDIDGNSHNIGSITYVGELDDSGTGSTYSESDVPNPKDYPIDFDIADYAPGGTVASAAGSQYYDVSDGAPAGSWNGSKWDVHTAALPPGVYYADGEIEVGSGVTVQAASEGETDGIVFVATGKITFKDNAVFEAWGHDANQGLVVFSTHPGTNSCTEVAIQMQGNRNEFGGIVLAKHGVARVQGNSDSAFGGVWGYRVEVEANTFAVTGPIIGAGGDPTVTFDE